MPSDRPARRIGDILRAIDRIRSYVDDVGGVDALVADEYVHRDGVERQLLVIAEATSKLRGQIEILEPEIDWHAIRGMGNVLRHNYDGVDDEVLREVLTEALDPLHAACERLLQRFEEHG